MLSAEPLEIMYLLSSTGSLDEVTVAAEAVFRRLCTDDAPLVGEPPVANPGAQVPASPGVEATAEGEGEEVDLDKACDGKLPKMRKKLLIL